MSDTFLMDDVPVYKPDGERVPTDFQCGYCERSFDTQAGMRRHQTRAHGTGNDTDPKAPKVSTAKARIAPLKGELVQMLQMVSLGVTFFNATDGTIIGANAEPVGQAWANLAQKNPAVDRALRALLAGSTYSEVILATSMMILPILANHRILPKHVLEMMGYVAAETVTNSPDAAQTFTNYYAASTNGSHSDVD